MNFRKLVCLGLSLCMCMGLAACAGKDRGIEPQVQSTVTAEPSHPDFVYTSEYKTLVKGTKDYLTVRDYSDDGFYVSAMVQGGEGIEPREGEEYAGRSTELYFVDFSGRMKKIENYSVLPPEQDEEGRRDFSSSADLSGISFSDDGFVTIEMVYSSWNAGNGNAQLYSEKYWAEQRFEQRFYIRSFDAQGNELSCALIPTEQDDYLDAYRMRLDSKGNALVTTGSGIRAIALDGSDAYTIDYDGFVDGFVTMADGSSAIFAWNDAKGKYMVHPLDVENGTVGQGTALNIDAYSAVMGSGEYDFYASNGTNFYGYKLGSDAPEKLFNWVGVDVNGSLINVLGVSEDGTVTGLLSRWNQSDDSTDYELVRVKKQPYDAVPHKETLSLGLLFLDYNVQDMVVDFNRSSDSCRIEIIDYSENTGGDWQAAADKLYADIDSGRIPDIFCLNGLNYKQLAAKGVLEDLYPYIDADAELSREDFFPNILAAMEIDGKLCSTVSGVYISTAIGASSVVGGGPGWTYEQFNETLSSMPKGCTAFDEYVTRDQILHACLSLDMDSFVDWNSGKSSFNSKPFIDLLNFAKSFPAEFDWESYSWDTAVSTEDRLASGMQMLVQASAYSIDDIFYNNYTTFMGSPISYIGYPTSSGTGNLFCLSESGYAMSNSSQHKDEVWQLLREFFTREYHDKYVYSLSSRIDVFEEKAKEAATIEYLKDENGNEILEDGEPVPVERYSMWNQYTDSVEKIYALSEEQVEQIRQLMKSTTKMGDNDSAIIEIVTEQAAPFFSGQKSAEDVAKLVQNRVDSYLNAQR